MQEIWRKSMKTGVDNSFWNTTKHDYLPSRLLLIKRGKSKALIWEDSAEKAHLNN